MFIIFIFVLITSIVIIIIISTVYSGIDLLFGIANLVENPWNFVILRHFMYVPKRNIRNI